MTIFFYKVDDPYGCFSNFSPHPIELEGHRWPTSEHYYQAQKFVGTPHQHLCEHIRTAPSPEQAAAIGRDQQHCPRADWDAVKPAVMYSAVLTKFLTHPELTNILLQTGNEPIIEDSPTDAYWGCGSDGAGQNQLGKILMQVRERLRNIEQ
jgi:N-glycosidase YbiA